MHRLHRTTAPLRPTVALRAVAVLLFAGTVAAACGGAPSATPAVKSPTRPTTANVTTYRTPRVPVTAAVVARTVTAKAPAKAPATTLPAPPATAPAPEVVSAHGVGPISFGMTVAQAEAAAGISIGQQWYDEAMCQLGSSSSLPGVVFDIDHQDDEITGVQISAPSVGIETSAGIGLGSTQDALHDAYGSSLHVLTHFGNTTEPAVAAYSVEAGNYRSIAFEMSGPGGPVGTIVAGAGADGLSFC